MVGYIRGRGGIEGGGERYREDDRDRRYPNGGNRYYRGSSSPYLKALVITLIITPIAYVVFFTGGMGKRMLGVIFRHLGTLGGIIILLLILYRVILAAVRGEIR